MVGRCFLQRTMRMLPAWRRKPEHGQAAGRAVIQSLEEDVAAMDVDVKF